MIGDFNDWKLPDSEFSKNGALKLQHRYDGTGAYDGVIDFPAGTHKFLIVELDRNFEFCYANSAYVPEFFLTNASGVDDWPIAWECTKEGHFHISRKDYITDYISKSIYPTKNLSDAEPITLKDWIGGEINIHYYRNSDVCFFSDVAPQYKPVTDDDFIYAVVKVDDYDPIILDSTYKRRNNYQTAIDVVGKKFSILFSTEKSLNPSPENCWGTSKSQKFDITLPENDSNTRLVADFINGGEPYIIEANEPGYLWLNPDWTSNEIGIRLCRHNFPQLTAEIVCDGVTRSEPVTYDATSGFSNPISVTGKDISIIFKIVNPDGKRKYYGQEDYCDNHKLRSSGNSDDSNSVKVEISGFDPYTVKFKDVGTLTAQISKIYGYAILSYTGEILEASASVTDIEDNTLNMTATPDEETYFDLSGKPVKNPGKGIFLKRKGSSFEKIVL